VTVNEQLVVEAIDRSTAVLDRIGRSVDNLNKRQQQANRTSKTQTDVLKSLRRTASNVNATFTLVIRGLKLMGVAFDATTGRAIKFQKAIAEVSTLVDSSTFSNKQLSDTVKGLAAQYGGDLGDTSKALYQVISAGATDAASANDVLQQSLILAKGGVTSVENAADGLTTVLNSYDLTAESAEKISDIMFATMRAGKTTIGELSQNLGFVSASAAQAGISFGELGAIIAAGSKRLGNARRVIIGLQSAISIIQKPSKEAREEAERLGIEFSAAALKSKGFVGILKQLVGNVDVADDTFGKLFGNVRAKRAVMALMSDDLKDVEQQLINVGGAAGDSREALSKMMDTTSEKLAKLNTNWEIFLTNIGDASASAIDLDQRITKANTTIVAFNAALERSQEPLVGTEKHTVAAGEAVLDLVKGYAALIALPITATYLGISEATAAFSENAAIALKLIEETGNAVQKSVPKFKFFATAASGLVTVGKPKVKVAKGTGKAASRAALADLRRLLEAELDPDKIRKEQLGAGSPFIEILVGDVAASEDEMRSALGNLFDALEGQTQKKLREFQDIFSDVGGAHFAALNPKDLATAEALIAKTLSRITQKHRSANAEILDAQIARLEQEQQNHLAATDRRHAAELEAELRQAERILNMKVDSAEQQLVFFTELSRARLTMEGEALAKVEAKAAKVFERIAEMNREAADKAAKRLAASFGRAVQTISGGIAGIGQAFQALKAQGVGTAEALRVAFAQTTLSIIDMIFKEILANLISASIAAAKSQAGIPLVGPILAVGAASATFGVLKAFVDRKLSEGISRQFGGPIPQLPGSIPGRDSVQVNAAPGESVLTVEETRQREEGRLDGQGGGGDIHLHLSSLALPDRVQADRLVNKELAPAVRRFRRRGGKI
jgi:TP901 family phage tail tape measure protein